MVSHFKVTAQTSSPKVVPVVELPDISKQEREAYQNVFSKVMQEEINGKKSDL